MVDQLVLGRAGTGHQLHERARHLAVARIRSTDDLDQLDRRMGDQVVLDLGRRHVLAADLEHVLEAAHECDPALGVLLEQIARVKPAVGVDHPCGVFRIAVIAREPRDAAEQQLPALAHLHFAPGVRIDEPQLHAREGPATGGDPNLEWIAVSPMHMKPNDSVEP